MYERGIRMRAGLDVHRITRSFCIVPILLCLCFLFSTSLCAEPDAIHLKDNLFGVDFVDGQNGWAAGYYGCIVHTSDGGRTWSFQACSTSHPLSSVDFVDRMNGWAVGYGPTILHTADGGNTWVSQKTDEEIAFLSAVRFVTDKKGWCVGEWGTVLYTDDGGLTWKPQSTGEDAILYNLDFADELINLW